MDCKYVYFLPLTKTQNTQSMNYANYGPVNNDVIPAMRSVVLKLIPHHLPARSNHMTKLANHVNNSAYRVNNSANHVTQQTNHVSNATNQVTRSTPNFVVDISPYERRCFHIFMITEEPNNFR